MTQCLVHDNSYFIIEVKFYNNVHKHLIKTNKFLTCKGEMTKIKNTRGENEGFGA